MVDAVYQTVHNVNSNCRQGYKEHNLNLVYNMYADCIYHYSATWPPYLI
jgi:hypothetical protein